MNGVISEGEVVKRWCPDGSGVRIETNRNVYLAQKLILSTGPWIRTTLPESKAGPVLSSLLLLQPSFRTL